FAAARGALAQFGAAPLPLDNTFALHPELTQLHAMYGQRELAVVHAVGLPYRERSHFDAQQVLESGGVRPYELSTGWLGRALAHSGAKGIALSTAVPLVLRGPGTIDTWAPSALPDPSAELVMPLERMYGSDDGPAKGATLLAQRAAEFLSQPSGPQAAVLELGGWDTHANQSAPNGALTNNLRTLDTGLAALRDGLVAGGAWKRSIVVVMTEFG